MLRQYEPGSEIVAGDQEDSDQLYIVKQGRLFASIELPDGQRAITRLYFKGDIVGTANMPFDRATQTITVYEPALIHVVPRQKLIDMFNEQPRIAALFYTFAALENAILNDRLVSIGRTRGKVRLASLILEIEARQRLADKSTDNRLRLGLNQTQIGDAIGLTSVQVNRLFKQLERDGLLKQDRPYIDILDGQKLAQIGRFHNRYSDLNLDWFDEGK